MLFEIDYLFSYSYSIPIRSFSSHHISSILRFIFSLPQTTSEDQRTKTRKLPEHSRARRRLFDAGPQDQAEKDNFANILQESINRDRDNLIKKYNFDPEKEVALEGHWEWYYNDENSWKTMKPVSKTKLEDESVPMEKKNQMTPKATVVEGPPAVRKRKRDGSLLSENGAKRHISFD